MYMETWRELFRIWIIPPSLRQNHERGERRGGENDNSRDLLRGEIGRIFSRYKFKIYIGWKNSKIRAEWVAFEWWCKIILDYIFDLKKIFLFYTSLHRLFRKELFKGGEEKKRNNGLQIVKKIRVDFLFQI